MRALLYRRYGSPDVLELGTLPDPSPEEGEVLVRVHAAAMNPKDVLVRKGKFKIVTGRRFPKVPGYDLAGEVLAAGPGVRRLVPGDKVFGMLNRWAAGAAAEFVVAPADELAKRPEGLDYPEAAAVPLAALTALQALRDVAQTRPGDRVLVNGGSGGVGTFAIQIARLLGAHVTAVSSAANRDLCLELGAHRHLDYRTEQAQEILHPTEGYDVFFDVFGNRPFEVARGALALRGRYVTTIPRARTAVQDVLTRLSRHPARLVVVRSRFADLDTLAHWVEAGTLRPVVDRVFSLAEGAEAHAYLETKRARGKVVLTVQGASA